MLPAAGVTATTMAGLGGAILLTFGACVPLGLSVWALLDITHRPSWAWALAGRPQVVWLASVLLGTLLLIAGMGVSIWYLLRVRPSIAAAEEGRIS